jgi:hypothetical protein
MGSLQHECNHCLSKYSTFNTTHNTNEPPLPHGGQMQYKLQVLSTQPPQPSPQLGSTAFLVPLLSITKGNLCCTHTQCSWECLWTVLAGTAPLKGNQHHGRRIPAHGYSESIQMTTQQEHRYMGTAGSLQQQAFRGGRQD